MTPRQRQARAEAAVRAEQDAQGLMEIRDTLELIDPDDYPRISKARRVACEAAALAEEASRILSERLAPCRMCGCTEAEVRLSDRWRARCPGCGWAVRADTWQEAEDEWNSDPGEEGERCRSASA